MAAIDIFVSTKLELRTHPEGVVGDEYTDAGVVWKRLTPELVKWARDRVYQAELKYLSAKPDAVRELRKRLELIEAKLAESQGPAEPSAVGGCKRCGAICAAYRAVVSYWRPFPSGAKNGGETIHLLCADCMRNDPIERPVTLVADLELRKPCAHCKCPRGRVERFEKRDRVYCARCSRFQYPAIVEQVQPEKPKRAATRKVPVKGTGDFHA